MDYLGKYLEAVEPLECPTSYHIFSFLGMISCLTGKRVFSRRGAITTYPNTLVCLIGDAGSGKTTAMSLTRRILRKVPEIHFAKKCPSAQEFMISCAAALTPYKRDGADFVHSPIAIFLSELSNFIQLSPELMIPFITDAYDDDHFSYGTKNKGCLTIEEPVLSGVVCCTHEWITRSQGIINFNDGIGRRFLWVMDRSEDRNAFPKAEVPEEILAGCLRMGELCGEFHWDASAIRWWTKWYGDYDRGGGQQTKSYFSTKHVHVEKVAMLLAMINRNELRYKVEDFERALELLALMEKNLARVFENIGRNPLMALSNTIMETVINGGVSGVRESTMRGSAFSVASLKEYEDMMTHLEKSGKITRSNGKVFPVKQEAEDGQQTQSDQAQGKEASVPESKLKIVKSGGDDGVEAQRVAL